MRRKSIRRNMRALGIAAAWATLVSIVACGGSSTPSSSGPAAAHIGLFVVTSASTWNQQFDIAAKEVLAKYPPGDVTIFDQSYDSNKEVNQLRDALVAKRFNIWIVNPVDGNAAAPVMEEAIKAGVKVVCLATTCGPQFVSNEIQVPGLVAFVNEGGFDLNGEYLADETGAACANKNPCKVFYMAGTSGAPYETARDLGWNRGLQKYPNIKVIARQDGKYTEATALSVTTNVLQAHRDIQVITTASDQMTVGAEKAVTLAGLKGKIILNGNGAGETGVAAVKAGRWFATAIDLPHTMGYQAALLGVQALRGSGISGQVINILAGKPHYIDNTNASSFTPEWSGA